MIFLHVAFKNATAKGVISSADPPNKNRSFTKLKSICIIISSLIRYLNNISLLGE